MLYSGVLGLLNITSLARVSAVLSVYAGSQRLSIL